jgi:hypothetical protein
MELIKIFVILMASGMFLYFTRGWWIDTLQSKDKNGKWVEKLSKPELKVPLVILGLILIGLTWSLTRPVVWAIMGPLFFGALALAIAGVITDPKTRTERRVKLDKSLNRLISIVMFIGIGFCLYQLSTGKNAVDEIQSRWQKGDLPSISWPWKSGTASAQQPLKEIRVGPLPAEAKDIMTCKVVVPASGWSETVGQACGTPDGGLRLDKGGIPVILTRQQLSQKSVTTDPLAPVLSWENGQTWLTAPHGTAQPVKLSKRGLRPEGILDAKFQSTDGKETTVTIYVYTK